VMRSFAGEMLGVNVWTFLLYISVNTHLLTRHIY